MGTEIVTEIGWVQGWAAISEFLVFSQASMSPGWGLADIAI